jgi:hypothetical protein
MIIKNTNYPLRVLLFSTCRVGAKSRYKRLFAGSRVVTIELYGSSLFNAGIISVVGERIGRWLAAGRAWYVAKPGGVAKTVV